MIHSFLKKIIASARGAPQENDAKFRFAIHPQEIQQHSKVPNCCHIGASLVQVPQIFLISNNIVFIHKSIEFVSKVQLLGINICARFLIDR